ncbi:MAG: FAD/NAD(P)-binding oxidoreductase [Thermoplasmataceae archaeon]
MAIPKKAIVLGDGTAGITVANKLRYLTSEKDLEVFVVGNSQRHFYKPDGILIPFGYKNYKKSIKPVEFLLNYGVNYVKDEVARVDLSQKIVFLRSGKSIIGDYIIIATGTAFSPEEIPGYNGEAKHFFDLQHALELKEYLYNFNGGDIVVGSTSKSIQYPQSLFEFSLLLNSFLEDRGVRQKSNILFLSSGDKLVPDAGLDKQIREMLQTRNIQVKDNAIVKAVNPKNKEVECTDGNKYKYSLLVLAPPHKGKNLQLPSSMIDEFGFVKVNQDTLILDGYPDIFAIGDANNLTAFKSAASAHLQATFVASRIVRDVSGGLLESAYKFKSPEIIFTDKDRAFTYLMSENGSKKRIYESKGDFILGWSSSDTYFSSIIRGMV